MALLRSSGRDKATAAATTAAEAEHDVGVVFKHFPLTIFEAPPPCTRDGIGRQWRAGAEGGGSLGWQTAACGEGRWAGASRGRGREGARVAARLGSGRRCAGKGAATVVPVCPSSAPPRWWGRRSPPPLGPRPAAAALAAATAATGTGRARRPTAAAHHPPPRGAVRADRSRRSTCARWPERDGERETSDILYMIGGPHHKKENVD